MIPLSDMASDRVQALDFRIVCVVYWKEVVTIMDAFSGENLPDKFHLAAWYTHTTHLKKKK